MRTSRGHQAEASPPVICSPGYMGEGICHCSRDVCRPSPAFWEPVPTASVHAQGTSDKLLLAKGKPAGTQARSENAPSWCNLPRSGGRRAQWRGLRGSSPPLTPTPVELKPSHSREQGETGTTASLQPERFIPLRVDAGRFSGTLVWVTLGLRCG